jgi:chromosome segregation ATPase
MNGVKNMKVKFRRSFLGYSPAGVEDLINSMENNFKNDIKKLKIQLADKISHLETLKAEIQKARDEINSYKTLENQVSQVLLQAHLEATERVFAVLEDADLEEKKAADRVRSKRADLLKLKATMDEIRKEIRTIAGQYKERFEKAGGE